MHAVTPGNLKQKMNRVGIRGDVNHNGTGGLVITTPDQDVSKSQMGWLNGCFDTLRAVGVKYAHKGIVRLS